MVHGTTQKYTVILSAETEPGFEGYYNAIVPALPGCVSYGASRDEALTSIREAIEAYIEDLVADGESIPKENIEAVGVEV
jgi:predicted RNase H-like HicB family nuclease